MKIIIALIIGFIIGFVWGFGYRGMLKDACKYYPVKDKINESDY